MELVHEPLQHFSSYLMYFLLTVIGLLTIFHFWFQSLRYTKLGNRIPGYTPLPIIGNALEALKFRTLSDIVDYALKMAEKKGKIFRIWFGTKLAVALLDPRDIELILGSNEHIEKSSEYRFFEPWLGDGLLISKGEKWKSHRKMITPTFHSTILKTFVPIFIKNANKLVNALKKEKGRIFDVHDYMSGTTVDILLETAMGVTKTKEDNTGFEYAKAVMDMCNILHVRHYKLWLRLDFIFNFTNMAQQQKKLLNIIHSLTEKVIKRKKQNYFQRKQTGEESLYSTAVKETQKEEEKNISLQFGTLLRDDLDDNDDDIGEKKRLAFLDFMIEASQYDGNHLTDKDIKEEVDTIMFEGHDTTAAASSFVFCMLAVHQDIQDKVYKELNEIFQNSNRTITFNDTLNMKYLERVILETLRLYPPVPVIARIIRKEIQLVSGNYILPKDTTVAIGTFLVHRDPDVYPNPDKFDPDNFLPEKCQTRPYYSFIPFSAGPRSCVGRKYAMLKLKVVLATVLRNFKVLRVVDEKDFKLQADIILKREDGFKIKLEERKV